MTIWITTLILVSFTLGVVFGFVLAAILHTGVKADESMGIEKD